MTPNDTVDALRGEIRAAGELLSRGALFTSFVNVGAVLASRGRLPSGQEDSILRDVEAELRGVDAAQLVEVRGVADRAFERLHRLIESPGSLLVEEIVLLLTLRLELAFAMTTAAEVFSDRWPYDFGICDVALEALSRSRTSSRAYASSIALIEKNWRATVPFSLEAVGVSRVWSSME